ncbi:MAG: phosphotransferase [Tenericutes bacterium]|nr:phosphotransferase [Mycoplasmatota bacterium]
MIEETVFSNKELIDIVKNKYEINVNKVHKLDRGSANLYSLNDDKYILKEFQSKYSKEEINKEIVIINHLKKDGLLVPKYIVTIDKEYCFIYKNKIIIMQKFIDGYTMEPNTGNLEQVIESACKLGKIVKSLKSLEIELPINDVSSWYSLDTLNESIQKHKDLLNKINENEYPNIYKDINEKIYMLEYTKNNYNFDEMKNLTFMNTHGDYSVLQFIYKNEKIKSIIDFVSACKMPIVWEIIRSYSYIDMKAKDGKIDIDNLVIYVKEFNKYVKLNKYDLKYMSYLYLIQILCSTFGYKQYISDNSKTELLNFARFRTKLSKYLFENAELISNILEKEIIK